MHWHTSPQVKRGWLAPLGNPSVAVFSSFSLILAKFPPSHFWPARGGGGGGDQPTQPQLATARNTASADFVIQKCSLDHLWIILLHFPNGMTHVKWHIHM